MTYREWLEKTLKPLSIGTEQLDLLLVNQVALIPNAEASVDVTTARTALCNELAFLLPLHSSISEGGMNLSFNYEAAKRYYEQLCILLKRTPTTKAQIRNRSNIW